MWQTLFTFAILMLFHTTSCLLSTNTTSVRKKQIIANINSNEQLIGLLDNTLKLMTRQLLLSQFYLMEKTRSDGDSGIKQIRHTAEGTRNYHAASHSSDSYASNHDHTNNDRTIGMGEVIVVMNGVEFRTRHNDYMLYMPSTTQTKLHAVEPITLPDVPPEVLQQGTVQEQIDEMKEWFKAWKNQDDSVRDYTKYFKPVISYMEGAWFKSTDQVDESFQSDRHQLDAKEWYELEEKIRQLSYTGGKQNKENLAYLPKVIMNVTDDNIPIIAQWNYRILCHPLSRDLPFNRLRIVDDLKARMKQSKTLSAFEFSKAARYSLNVLDKPFVSDIVSYNYLLEEMMNEIPGKDNYGVDLTDYGYDGEYRTPKGDHLNAGKYHRRFSRSSDASGRPKTMRGFSDQNLFMAMTTQPDIVGMDNIVCNTGERECPTSEYQHQKWTYAIPLEIIYLTPFTKWNPYKITDKGHCKQDESGKTVYADGRDGSEAKPYNGSCNSKFFRLPSEFLDADENPDLADTTPKEAVWVLDENGVKRKVRASGHRIIIPNIPGVGPIRQRYPISPVHGEGSGVWKELEALQDIVLKSQTFSNMYYETT